MRAGISEDETAESAREKLRESVAAHVPDADEREWLEPRLGHLLGLAERAAHDREDLFSAWRLFFERLADVNPTVLVFEDLQWADPGLLDFIDYLLEWSRNHPIFVLALTRPELHEKRAGWGAAKRNSSTLLLEPLSPAAMEQLLDGLVPGLPDDLRAQILQRAEGVPLYAVETLRMLLDQSLLERRGDTFAVTGSVAALEVPETLHALIAARLDGLGPDERRLLQDASVLGKSFTKEGVASLSGLDRDEVERLLSSLTRKEILTLQADPRSPERGQYVFLQDLLKRVAYETQAKKDRKARHLAAAAHLEQATGSAEQEAVAVVAAHYLDAHRAAPDAEDAPAIKAKAAACLAQAGERAQALAATEEARNYLEQAAELTDDGLQRASLLERAGLAATDVGPFADAVRLFAQAVELYRAEGEVHAAARAAAWQGFSTWQGGDLEGGSRLLEESLETVADEEPDADLAELAEVRARLRFFLGDVEGASTRVERALEIAEALYVPGVLVDALNTKHLVLGASGREEEALALLQRAIELGRQHDLGHRLLRALYNLSYQMTVRDDNRAAVQIDLECLEIARRRGDRVGEMMANGHLGYAYYALGDWDEVDRILAELDSSNVDRSVLDRVGIGIPLLVGRGDLAEARSRLEEGDSSRTSGEIQQRAGYLLCEGWLLTAEGRPAEGLAAFREALALEDRLQPRHPFTKYTLIGALEAALAVPDLDAASELLDLWEAMRPVDRTPLLEAHWERARAALAVARGDADSAEPSLAKSLEIFRKLEMPYDVGTSLVAQAEWLVGRDREAEAEPLVAEAREIFQRLRARPMLERLAALESRGAAVSA